VRRHRGDQRRFELFIDTPGLWGDCIGAQRTNQKIIAGVKLKTS
jgi:hypothetical protein